MTLTRPPVRDFTATETPLHVEIDVSPAYELVMALFTFACEDRAEYEVGPNWFETHYDAASATLQKSLDEVLEFGELLVGLVSFVHDMPEPRTPRGLIEHLAGADPVELRLRLLSCCLGAAPDVLRGAAAGTPEAIEALLAAPDVEKYADRLRTALERDPEETRDAIVRTLQGFSEELLTDLETDVAPILERDGRDKKAMAETMPPEQLVEVATNGVTVAPQSGVARVVLIPSVVIRPWVVIAEHGPVRLFAYPVSDESMADPDAPPEWIVKFYKALGDERRLRILNLLTEGPARLTDLAEHLDLSKSTVHHHMVLLRHAGLVRVTIGADKEYSLRTDAIPQAGPLLETYLRRATSSEEDDQ